MKRVLIILVISLVVGCAIKVGHDYKVKCELKKQTQEAMYINQMESDRCAQYLQGNKDGVCD